MNTIETLNAMEIEDALTSYYRAEDTLLKTDNSGHLFADVYLKDITNDNDEYITEIHGFACRCCGALFPNKMRAREHLQSHFLQISENRGRNNEAKN